MSEYLRLISHDMIIIIFLSRILGKIIFHYLVKPFIEFDHTYLIEWFISWRIYFLSKTVFIFLFFAFDDIGKLISTNKISYSFIKIRMNNTIVFFKNTPAKILEIIINILYHCMTYRTDRIMINTTTLVATITTISIHKCIWFTGNTTKFTREDRSITLNVFLYRLRFFYKESITRANVFSTFFVKIKYL